MIQISNVDLRNLILVVCKFAQENVNFIASVDAAHRIELATLYRRPWKKQLQQQLGLIKKFATDSLVQL